MEAILNLLIQSMAKVLMSFAHNWPFLLASVLISVALRLYIQPEKASAFLTRYRRVGVVGATAVAVTTPFCSCGTTAVVLGMIASTVPWAPIVAFMVASPLTSPEEMIYSAGLFGWPFAGAFFVSSILLGLLGGLVAEIFESRGWLANQARFNRQPTAVSAAAAASAAATDPKQAETAPAGQGCSCGAATRQTNRTAQVRDILPMHAVLIANPALEFETCCGPALSDPVEGCGCQPVPVPVTASSCGCGGEARQPAEDEVSQKAATTSPSAQKVTARQWFEEIYRTGKQLLVMFFGFAFIGYVINGLIPETWIPAIFGSGHVYSVPLAATLGLPLYINTEGSLPLVRSLIDGGMSQGAALAFLITGAGTSIGAFTGALTIARWRVIGLVVGTLWVGAIVLGFAYDLMLAAHLF